MTATNHMLTGAVVAVGLQHPLLVAPVAVVSHFLLDAMPHFGIHKDDAAKRNKHPLFQYILIIDTFLAISLLLLLPNILSGVISSWLLIGGMILAFIPDAVWMYQAFYEKKFSQEFKIKGLTKVHDKIQWGERPWGIFVELIFFGFMGVCLEAIAVT